MVAPYAGHNVDPIIFSLTNYSGESIDVDMFDGIPGEERESHPGDLELVLKIPKLRANCLLNHRSL